MFTLFSESIAKTLDMGEALGRTLKGGEMLALNGELGVGKTVLVKGVARGLEITDVVTSPSFVLVKSYRGRILLHHVDFYRLQAPEELETIGFNDFLNDQDVLAIEWADKFPHVLPLPFLHITISYRDENQRLLKFEWRGDVEWEKQLDQALGAFS